MPKHKKRRVIEVAPAADYGPAMIRDCDGRLRAAWDGAAAGIELADVPDSVGNPDTLGFMTMPRAGAALGR